MINRNSQPLTRILFAAITTIGFIFITQTVLSQGTFAPGDKVMASPSMLKDDKYYRACTVVKFDETAKAYNLNCDGTEYYVPATYVRAAKPAPEPQQKTPDANQEPAGDDPPLTDPANNRTPAKYRAEKFKVGDRVMASPRMLKDQKYYQPCTVTSVIPPNSYGLRCDPFNGISYEDYSVREDFVRPGLNAPAAPVLECSLEQPPAVDIKTAPASAAVFKRIIYEWEAARESRTRVGLKFESFEIGRTFRNVYVNSKNGLIAEGFPQNATIYPVKTKFVLCVEGTDLNKRTVVEIGNYCGKNRFGEWSCGAGGGTRRSSPLEYVPK